MRDTKGTYYFLGIGGIGMSALARYFHRLGYQVSGYDRAETELTQMLVDEGIPVHYDDNPQKIPTSVDLVVYTPAIPKENMEYQYILEKKFSLKKRSEVLGELAKNKKTIAVAGTHGKTTVSSMIMHIFNNSSKGCNAFLGGISKNIDSNLLVNNASEYLVVEADEFDRSFLSLYPYCSVVTSADADHLDIYGSHSQMLSSFQDFVNHTQENGFLLLKSGLPFEAPSNVTRCTYSLNNPGADFYAWNIRTYKGMYYFDFRHPEAVFFDIELTYPGLHNIENAVAALAVAMQCGIGEEELRNALRTFSGVKRRFDYRINRPDFIYIDDYAHHPKELEMAIESVKHLYPNKKITGVFQPHLYSRTRDLADNFVSVLELLDEVILLDIYPAREQPIPGIDAKMLLHKINKMDKYYSTKEGLCDLLEALNPEILLTIGAGDIDKLVKPIEERFN